MKAGPSTTMLAIDGGRPVRATRLPYGRQSIDDRDVRAVVDALRSSHLTTGPRVGEFEEAFAAAVGARYAVAVSSGTAALHTAAWAAGIDSGAEAITTPMTFAATANCIRYLGGRAIFADVRPDTLCIDPVAVEAALTPATRAVLAVDYAGQPADLDELLTLAARHGVVLIEDGCHALGATYRGRRVGQIAHLTVFSLHPVKHITSGEGGVVTTDDPVMAERLRMFRNHGMSAEYETRERAASWEYDMRALGYNYRLTDLQCALARSQLQKLDGWVARRRVIAARYREALGDLPEIEPLATLPDREPSWHLYVVRLRLERLRVGRREIFRALVAENIGVNVHYIPVPWHTYYAELGYRRGSWRVAETEYERLLSLPMFPAMTDEDIDDVVEAMHKILAAYRL
jgi:UDP-4-amino-4,6-dideoxy-N-acetyl-beta-L-altrosamine transaminase